MAEQHRIYISGEWRETGSNGTVGVINPATEGTVAEVPYGGRAEVKEALAAAATALGPWQARTAYERGEVLTTAARLVRERAEGIGRWLTLETGKPLPQSVAEVRLAADYFAWYAEEGKRVYGRIVPSSRAGRRRWVIRHPVGVCAAISPWNFPVVLPARKIAPALAAGCTVVARPATQAPLAATELIRCVHDAGAPPGVVNHVTGPAVECTAEFMANAICRKISFTGSTEVGRELIRQSAEQMKRLSLELGGSAPVLVFADVDVEAVAQATVTGKFRNMGQVCIAPTRFYVHESIAEAYIEAVRRCVLALRVGDGLEEGVECGPMFSRELLERAEDFVKDAVSKGATVVCGGKRAEGFAKGYYYEPTVLTGVSPRMRLTCEEVFGPIMPIMTFRTVEEAIRLANATEYGLAAYLFTEHMPTVLETTEALEAGVIGVNDMVPPAAEAPFGGMKQSGAGSEGGTEGIESYLETKYVSVG